jgi:hypothetical protein
MRADWGIRVRTLEGRWGECGCVPCPPQQEFTKLGPR